ncbi:MAG: carbohydrate-binding protein, partial [Pedobacter sp.]
YVTDIHGGDYIKIRQVSFKQSPKSFEAKVRGLQGGGSIDIRLDSLQGRSIGQLLVPASDKNMKWTLVKCKTANVKGTYDLFFVFTGTGKELFDFDSWMFK